LDKFIGDAVMAFWGAPIEQKDQADRAVKAALGMLRRLKVLQEKWKNLGWPVVDIGIGIHTGLVTVGNMGSEKRFDYTVIGDTVNVASRLEGLNKDYKTHFIISEATKQKLTIPIQSRPLGEATVKGKQQAIKIFEVF
jgi:adenylate cyclase